MPLAGPFGVAATVLALAGLWKVATPLPTVTALRSIGVRLPVPLVRVGAGLEVVVGVTALVTGWRAMAALVAVCYLCFVAFVSVHLLRGGVASSCGCFGEVEAKPDAVHLRINLAGAGCGLAAAVWPVPGLLSALRTSPLEGLALSGFVALGCWFTYLALTALPRLDGARAAGAAARRAPARAGT